jgi:polyisoprenoid-binding protein YceI
MWLFRGRWTRPAALFGMALLSAATAVAGETCDVRGASANRVPVSPAQVAGQYALDKDKSKMEFCVTHFPFSEVRGTFADFEGGFVIPPTALERSHVKVVLESGSVDTRSTMVDKMVTGEDFFDVQRHPEIRFVSTGIQLTGDGKAILTGKLTLLGVTRLVSFDVNYAFDKFDPTTLERGMTFYAKGEVSRSEFGMETLPGVVSDKVRICMQGVGRRIARLEPVAP